MTTSTDTDTDTDTAVTAVTAVEAALDRIDTELSATADTDARPEPAERRTIVVLSPKGGVGRTTVATNLAIALARRAGVDVGLLDLSLAFGDVATAMLLDPRHGLADLARLPRPISPPVVTAALTRHASGVHVLTAPENPVDGEEFGTDDITCVFDGLAALPRLVVDTPAGLDANTLVAVEHATDLVLVATLDVPTLLGLRQAIVLLERLGIAPSKRHLVLSRDGLRNGIDRADVESTLGLPVTVAVPDDRLIAAATNEGHPIVETAPRSVAGKAFDQLAAAIEGIEPPTRPRRTLGARRQRRTT